MNSASRTALLIAHAYPPENLAGALRPFRFARYLPALGYRPVVITASVQPHPAPAGVYYSPRPKGFKARFARRFFFPTDDDMLWTGRTFEVIKEFWSREKPDVILSTHPPLSAHWLARRLKRTFGVPWVADFRDPLVGNFVRTRIFNRSADPWFERRIVHDADWVLLNTDRARALYEQRYPEYKSKLDLLYNGFDPHDGLGPQPAPARPRRQWIHAGSLYTFRDVERLMLALEQLIRNDRIEAPVLRLIGMYDFPLLERLPAWPFFRDRGLMECVPRGVPREQAWRELSQADTTLIFDPHQGDKPHFAMSSKVLECVRVGRPLLTFTSPHAGMAAVVAQSGIPHVLIFHDESTEQVAAKLVPFSKLPAASTPPSEWFLRTFNCISQTEYLAAIFDRIQS